MKRLLLFAAFIAAIGTASCQSQDTTGSSFDWEAYELQKQLVKEHYAHHDSIQALGAEIGRLKNEILLQGKDINQIQTNLFTASKHYHGAEVCLGFSIGLAVLSGVLLAVNAFQPNQALPVFGAVSGICSIGTGIASIVKWSKGNKALKVNMPIVNDIPAKNNNTDFDSMY